MAELKIRRKPYFYDAQRKRIIVQILSCFAGYTVRSGVQRDGKHRQMDVPIMYGDYSRMGAYVVNGGNENVVQALPIMSVSITGEQQDPVHRRSPQHYETQYYAERAVDNDEMGTAKGDEKIVQRYMPVPYIMNFDVMIWASNNDQGFQLTEQIMTQFNPEQDIQLSNSPADWTFMSILTFDGTIQAGRVALDVGSGTGDDPIYTWTMGFTLQPVYFNPPAKVYDAKKIETVHVPILDLNDPIDFDTMDEIDTLVITSAE